jgi:hypothetical protein
MFLLVIVTELWWMNHEWLQLRWGHNRSEMVAVYEKLYTIPLRNCNLSETVSVPIIKADTDINSHTADHRIRIMTNSMKQSIPAKLVAAQLVNKFSDFFLGGVGNLKLHYRVHKSPQLAPILSQINTVHTVLCVFKISLILSFNQRCLSGGIFPSGSCTKTWISHLSHVCFMPHPYHSP